MWAAEQAKEEESQLPLGDIEAATQGDPEEEGQQKEENG